MNVKYFLRLKFIKGRRDKKWWLFQNRHHVTHRLCSECTLSAFDARLSLLYNIFATFNIHLQIHKSEKKTAFKRNWVYIYIFYLA